MARVAVLIPCYNEAVALPHVIAAFRAALPAADIYAYDNNSADDTAAVARAAGARVGRERRQGKGHVVRRMFADVDADVFVLVDGDDTYDAAAAPAMRRSPHGAGTVSAMRCSPAWYHACSAPR